MRGLAAKELEDRGISAQVIGMPTIVPADKETVILAAKRTGRFMCRGLGRH